MWLLGKVIACFFMCCMVGCLWVSGPACARGERSVCSCCMASCVVLILYWEFCFSRVVMVIELLVFFCVCCDVVVVVCVVVVGS